MNHQPDTQPLYVIAVVSDTHVPDRCKKLPEGLIGQLTALQPDLILHAGDIVSPKVITILENVAPVVMVQGNRDIYLFPHVPRRKYFLIHGTRLVLMHGHATLLRYIINKIKYFLLPFRLSWFWPTLIKEKGDADIVIFGHTHRSMNEIVDDVVFLNPGSITISPERGEPLSFGVIRLFQDAEFDCEIIEISSN